MTKIFIGFIYVYQRLISPILPKSCRFTPTCSEYAIDALKKYGLLSGGYKATCRVLKCQPFSRGGYDPLD